MAFTAEKIKQDAEAWAAAGASPQQIMAAAKSKGVSLADLSSAYGLDAAGGASWFADKGVDVGNWGAAPAPAPAPAPSFADPAPAPQPQTTLSGYTTDEIRNTVNARLGAGSTAQDIWNEAKSKKVGVDDLALSFGMTLDDGKKWFADRGVNVNPTVAPSAPKGGDFSTTTLNAGQPTMSVQPREAATPWNVAPNQTTANQIETIIAKDSPLMQQARMRALQSQNASGRLNSTMAASAGEAAVFDAALPIATADARTFADAAQFNAGNESTFSRDFNAWQRERDMANFNVSANDWADDRAIGRTTTLNNLAEQRDNRQGDLNLQREIALRGTRSADSIANDSANKTAEDATLRRGYINTITQTRADFAAKLTGITQDPNMSSELKTDAIKDLRGTYNRTITNFATLLGWKPEDWIINVEGSQTGATA